MKARGPGAAEGETAGDLNGAPEVARRNGGDSGGRRGDAGQPDVALLARELQQVLNGPEGEEKLRQALSVIEQLLHFEPEKVDLLERKLTYALALGEEEAAIRAYLDLGAALEKRLSLFSLRFLTTSSSSGSLTTAVTVEERRATVTAD